MEKKDRVKIDFDNWPEYDSSLDVPRTKDSRVGVCGKAIPTKGWENQTSDEMEKKQIIFDFDNQPKAKEPMKGEIHRIERKKADK